MKRYDHRIQVNISNTDKDVTESEQIRSQTVIMKAFSLLSQTAELDTLLSWTSFWKFVRENGLISVDAPKPFTSATGGMNANLFQ